MSELNDNIKNAKDEMDELLFATRDFTSEAGKSAKLFFESKIQVLETQKAFKGISKIQEAISLSVEDIISGTKSLNDLTKIQNKSYESRKKLNLEFKQALGSIKLDEKQISQIVSGNLDVFTAINSQSDDLRDGQLELLNTYSEQFKTIKDTNDELVHVEKRAREIDKGFGLTGKTIEGIGGILQKIGLGSLSDKLKIDQVVNEGRMFSAELVKQNGGISDLSVKTKVFKSMVGSLGKNLVSSLGPVAIIAGLIKSMVSAFMFLEHSSGEIAKEYGVSAHEGEKLVMASNEAAMNSNDILVSTKDVVKAQMELNKIFGTSVQFSGEFAAEFASIQERTGLSGEAMGFFAEQALHAHTSIKDQLESVVGLTMELNAQNGVSISRKEIEEGLGKLTSAQLLTAKYNTKELVNQVFQAKMLGVEMSAVEAISQSLLSFESSIQSEMEAELLTGKQLNLETARQAALQGDLATVAKEVAEQMGNAEEFGKMNVIQQEALAQAVGMTRGDLADALAEQEKLKAVQKAGFKDMSDVQNQYNEALKNGNMTEELSNKLKEAGVLEQMESATAQEKMAAMLEKIQSLFISIAGPLMEIITPIVDILAPILGTIVSIVGYIVSGLKSMGPALIPIIALMGILALRAKSAAIMSMIKGAWTSLGAIPFVGPVLAAAAIAGGIGYINSQKMKDGVIGPGGEMVVSGPKGSIQLDKEDSLIAGTDLGGKNKTKKEGSTQGPNVDLSPLIAAVNATNQLLQQLLTKKGDVYIDGAKAGYSMTLADSKMG